MDFGVYFPEDLFVESDRGADFVDLGFLLDDPHVFDETGKRDCFNTQTGAFFCELAREGVQGVVTFKAQTPDPKVWENVFQKRQKTFRVEGDGRLRRFGFCLQLKTEIGQQMDLSGGRNEQDSGTLADTVVRGGIAAQVAAVCRFADQDGIKLFPSQCRLNLVNPFLMVHCRRAAESGRQAFLEHLLALIQGLVILSIQIAEHAGPLFLVLRMHGRIHCDLTGRLSSLGHLLFELGADCTLELLFYLLLMLIVVSQELLYLGADRGEIACRLAQFQQALQGFSARFDKFFVSGEHDISKECLGHAGPDGHLPVGGLLQQIVDQALSFVVQEIGRHPHSKSI